MDEKWVTAGVAIIGTIVSLAILSVLLSPQAQTSNVIDSVSRGLSSLINAATKPLASGNTLGG